MLIPASPDPSEWKPPAIALNFRPTMNLQFRKGILEQEWVSDDGSKREWRPVQSVG